MALIYVDPLDLPQWNPIDQPIDKVVFDLVYVTPGLAEIVGASAKRRWEDYSGANWSGGILLFRGWPLASFVVRLHLYETVDWDQWNALRPRLLQPPGGKFPRPFRISHPFLAQLSIGSCVIEAVRAPDHIGGGEWTVDIDCIEHRPLRSGGARMNDEESEPVDPMQAQIDALEKLRDKGQSELDRLARENNLPGSGLLDLLMGRR